MTAVLRACQRLRLGACRRLPGTCSSPLGAFCDGGAERAGLAPPLLYSAQPLLAPSLAGSSALCHSLARPAPQPASAAGAAGGSGAAGSGGAAASGLPPAVAAARQLLVEVQLGQRPDLLLRVSALFDKHGNCTGAPWPPALRTKAGLLRKSAAKPVLKVLDAVAAAMGGALQACLLVQYAEQLAPQTPAVACAAPPEAPAAADSVAQAAAGATGTLDPRVRQLAASTLSHGLAGAGQALDSAEAEAWRRWAEGDASTERDRVFAAWSVQRWAEQWPMPRLAVTLLASCGSAGDSDTDSGGKTTDSDSDSDASDAEAAGDSGSDGKLVRAAAARLLLAQLVPAGTTKKGQAVRRKRVSVALRHLQLSGMAGTDAGGCAAAVQQWAQLCFGKDQRLLLCLHEYCMRNNSIGFDRFDGDLYSFGGLADTVTWTSKLLLNAMLPIAAVSGKQRGWPPSYTVPQIVWELLFNRTDAHIKQLATKALLQLAQRSQRVRQELALPRNIEHLALHFKWDNSVQRALQNKLLSVLAASEQGTSLRQFVAAHGFRHTRSMTPKQWAAWWRALQTAVGLL